MLILMINPITSRPVRDNRIGMGTAFAVSTTQPFNSSTAHFGLCNERFSFDIGTVILPMDASTSLPAAAGHQGPHHHDAEHEHHELGWWRTYIFSTDHKMIGIQYGLCGLIFLFFGFSLMMLK